MLDKEAIYHVCPNRDWFSNFEKLDGCSILMGDDRLYNMEGICTVLIKIFDGMVQELKKVMYVPQLKRNRISVGAFKALGLKVSVKDGILKMTRVSMVVLKGVRRNNLYCLKDSTVTKQVITSINLDDGCIRVWHMRLGYTCEKSL